MKIGLIGAGRLGLCLALLIERAGYDVIVSDIRTAYVSGLNDRKVETNEPDVEYLLKESKNFKATTDNKEVIDQCDIIFTLVATPSLEDGSYDVSSVDDVVDELKKVDGINGKSFVVGCTTNPRDCKRWEEKLSDCGVDVYYNPEFIAQGSIIKDLQNADMVLVGGYGHHISVIEDIYNKIQVKKPSIHFMSTTAAELVKLAVNCYLTTKISYANMVGEIMISSGMKDEVDSVLSAIGADSRVGNKYLKYGYGFGGPCLPRDNRAFASFANKLGMKYNLGETTDNFNNEHAKFLKNYFIKQNKDNLPFCFEYISYKKGTDILTESQQYRLCLDLLDSGSKVYVVEQKCIVDQIYDKLYNQYPSQITFVYDKKHLPQHIFFIKL
tara:strand:- start:2689 stop:3837 length:1149 start_codon:yes stop_codon:yes gene_type:complete